MNLKNILITLTISFLFFSFNTNNIILVTDYLPKSYVKDGSVSYQKEIQKAIDLAADISAEIVFPPMIYSIDESGFKISSNSIITMYGAIFKLKENCKSDGFVFWGNNVSNVHFRGGEVVGRNDVWAEGINIRGIYITGKSKNIRITDMNINDLSSNGIGIFGDPENYIKDIWVTNVIIDNSCNTYGDYTSKRHGPEIGSDRKDQGLITFWYCEDFQVSGSRLDRSRSYGTHFYKSNRGQFINNKVYAAKMGGYFVEGCLDVVASGNIIKDNGSRGTTIERGSIRCNLVNNVVTNSGREGLWAPDCVGLVVSGNIFDRNGRKKLGSKPDQIWNANITINEAFDPTDSPTTKYLIIDNIIYTDSSQHTAIYIDADKASNIIIKDNFFRGDNDRISIVGENKENIIIENNY